MSVIKFTNGKFPVLNINGTKKLIDLPSSVLIGGRKYPTVKIGNQLWMAENLDYLINGIPLSTSQSNSDTTPKCYYYNNDESTYGYNGYKCGLLYNGYAVLYMAEHANVLFPSGWRVATYNDYGMIAALGDINKLGTNLKAKSGSIANNFPQNNWNGDNLLGFSGIPAGVAANGIYRDFGVYARLWTSTPSSNYIHQMGLSTSSEFGYGSNWWSSKYVGASVRLVKDVA